MGWMNSMCRGLLLFVAVLMPLSGCSGGPTFLSWQEEVALGEQAAPEFIEQGGGRLDDSSITMYVRDMGFKLARIAERQTPDEDRPPLDWEFHVLDSEVINAFALPGGKVFISRGLMQQMNNEAQLAGVIGHEIGHVMARHGNKRMSQAMILQGAIVAVGVAGTFSDSEWMQVLGVGTAAGGQLFLLRYSRENELESDALGVSYMAEAGYNPLGQVQVMEILGRASGGGAPPEWLSTHPASDTRVEALEAIIDERFPRAYDSDYYQTGEQDYERQVLIPLRLLPPAKHGSSAMLGPEQFEAISGIPWEQVAYVGCGCANHGSSK